MSIIWVNLTIAYFSVKIYSYISICYICNMLAISTAVERKVLENPFLFEVLSQKLANLSKISEAIHKDIENRTQKTVNRGSIVVALARLSKKLQRKQSWSRIVKSNLKDLNVKAPIWQFVVDKDMAALKSISAIQERLVSEFLSFTVGEKEINVVCSPSYVKEIRERLPYKQEIPNLALLTIHFNEKLVQTPGLIYYISSLMFLNNINLTEIISTYTELNLVIKPDMLEKAVNVLIHQFGIGMGR